MRILSQLHKQRISEAMKGNKNSLGKKYFNRKTPLHSEEHKQKISRALLGRKRPPFSDEWRKKLSDAKKGKARKGNPENWKISSETKNKISRKLSGKPRPWQIGENNPSWNGGNSPLNKLIRVSLSYKAWRSKVLKRDSYTCTLCGTKNVPIHADHITTFSKLLKENGIKTLEEAVRCQNLWDCNNGRTLCVDCHKKTDTYGHRTSYVRD